MTRNVKTLALFLGLMAPTLLLLSGQALSGHPRVFFDEAYLGPQGQLWIRYHSREKKSFQGVLSTSVKQTAIHGFRVGNRWWIQGEQNTWQGALKPGSGCEGKMNLWSVREPNSKLLLKSNFCISVR